MKFNPPIIKSFNKAPSVKSFMILASMIIWSLTQQNLLAQSVSVDISQSPTQLVDILMDASCAVRSNQNISSAQSVGYFSNNNSNFPITEGVIIRNGKALLSQGPYTGQGLSSQVTTDGDQELQSISDSSGQLSSILDVGYLEFDFVPNGNQFNFNFLFASNEYGQWQCGFSDVFAFLLTDLATGETKNLAVVPGTTTPISVKDIRNSDYNSSCNSVNANLFSTYNVNNPTASSLNMRGYTVVMNASSDVIPGNTYRIKLAIGDYNDADFDSAVFIEAGSFTSFVDLGEDQALCGNDQVLLDTHITDTTNYSFTWTKDGAIIPGANGTTLSVASIGTYGVSISGNNGCLLTDEVVISDLQIAAPSDITTCENGTDTFFDLTLNDENALGVDPNKYEALFYSSLSNANNNISIPTSSLSNYESSGNQTIYIKLKNKNSGTFCSALLSFNLIASSFTVGEPDDLNVCQNISNIDIISSVQDQILNGLNPSEYTVTYHVNLDDANTGENAIASAASFVTPSTNTTLWARTTDNTVGCYRVVDFDLGILSVPSIDDILDIVVCESFTLPPLNFGTYYLGSGGTGGSLNPGDVIQGTSRIYIYNENSEGCSIETSFKVEVLQSYEIDTDHCSLFTVPTPPAGSFYTQPGGPNGTGTELMPGDEITTSQRIYYFAEFNNLPCTDRPFDITIHPPPVIDEFDDIAVCNSYILPSLVNGDYFTGPSGSGNMVAPGTEITSTQTLYIFKDDGTCTNERSFKIHIIDPSSFSDVSKCGSYELPSVGYGGYFTEPNGNGMSIPEGTVINQSTTVFYYAEVSEGVNCTSNLSFTVDILPLPPVTDTFTDVVRCITHPYELEALEFGSYFTEPDGQGTQLNPGDIITSTQTIYIYNTNSVCSNEHSFEVEIRPLPSVDNFTDIFTCDPYILPPLANGNYYSESNGQGVQLSAGDVLSETQTVYIYNQYSDLGACASENVFTVFVLGVNVDDVQDVNACDSYVLPTLTEGNYFTESMGQGSQLMPGDVITSSQRLYIYKENGERFFCFDEKQFVINISTTPSLQNFENQESCGSYTLPEISSSDFNVTFYRQPNGVNLIDPSEYTLTTPGIYTIHARTSATDNPNCYVDEVFSVTVYPLRELIIEDAIICVDFESGLTTQTAILSSGLDPTSYTVNWYLNNELQGTGTDFEATEVGVYTVETIKLTPDVGNDCNFATTSVEVKASSPEPKITFLTEPFDALSNIRVDFVNLGLGNYEYSLDNGPFQSNNIFLNIPIGEHTITIRDTSGLCGNKTLSFKAIGYPQFFTPNGDGVNDTWNIPDLKNYANANIKIFDRYGNLLSEIKPSGEGWNGISKTGNQLPANSYWFRVQYTFEGVAKSFSSYFALKR